MASIGDHVSTVWGTGTVITNKRVVLHGKKDVIKSIAEKGAVKGVIKTKQQIEEESKALHKKEQSE